MQETFYNIKQIIPEKNLPCHIIVKKLSIQNKERILKSTRKQKQLTYKGKLLRIAVVSLKVNLKSTGS
jgi:predicted methyltransferase